METQKALMWDGPSALAIRWAGHLAETMEQMKDAPKYVSEIQGQGSGVDSDSQWGPDPVTFASTTAALALLLLAWAIHTLRANGGLKMLDPWLGPSDINDM